MVVCLSLKFAAFLFFICGRCVSESFADGLFRTTNSGPKPLWSDTTLDKLKKDLLMNYDKHARPEEHYNTTVVILGMTILHLETNELKSSVTAHVWLTMIESSMSWSTWNISNLTEEVLYTEHSCCVEPFYTAEFNLTLVRKSGPYKAIVVTPAVVIAMLVLSQFWLPPQAKERLILNGFVVVTIVMFLTYFTNQIAAAGSGTPFIVTFYSNSLYMVCHSMLATAAVLSMSRINKKSTSLPWPVKKHLKGKLGKWLLLEYTLEKNSTNEVLSENHTVKSDVRRRSEDGYQVKFALEKESKENLLLALLIDRLLFVVYIILVLVVIIEYYVI